MCKRYICSMHKANTGEAKQCTEMVKWCSMTPRSLCYLVEPDIARGCSKLVYGDCCEVCRFTLHLSRFKSKNKEVGTRGSLNTP